MSIFSKLKSRKLSKTLAAVLAGGALFFGAGNLAEADSNAEFAFKQAYLSVPQNDRAFRQSIDFFGTVFHAGITTQGKILRDATMQLSGNFNWNYTNLSTNVTINRDMPFYITQNESEITLYIQRYGKWNKFSLPGIPANFANALKSSDIKTLQENFKAVRYVEIFRETNAQQIFNITLDGKYLSRLLEEYSQNPSTAGLSQDEIAAQASFIRNLQAALQKTDIVCTWTFDKINNRTITTVVDFTDLMRAYAKNVLDDSAAGRVVLTEEERMLLDTIGYYSEFHYAFTYNNDGSEENYTAPSAAQKASVNKNIFNDLIRDMTTTVRR